MVSFLAVLAYLPEGGWRKINSVVVKVAQLCLAVRFFSWVRAVLQQKLLVGEALLGRMLVE